MATWFTNSVAWTAATAWATGTVKAAGNLVRQLAAPAVGSERVFVCTIAGTTHATTEPTWVITKGAKTTDNTITWMECTGQPGVNGSLTYCPNWTAVKNIALALGVVIQNNAGSFLFIVTTAGTTGNGAEPTWNTTAGVTTVDNSVTWTSIGAVGTFASYAAPFARLQSAYASTWGAAGDTFFVSDNHAETQAATMSLVSPATAAAQSFVYCVDHTVANPGTGNLKKTATITTTGAFGMSATIGGYYYGIIFQIGSGAVTNIFTLSGNTATTILDNCAIQKLGTTANNAAITVSGILVLWKNTTVQFGNVGDAILISGGANLRWTATPSAIAGATIPTTFFAKAAGLGNAFVSDVDLSALGSGTIVGSAGNSSRYVFLNCKAGSGYVVAGAVGVGTVVDWIISDSGAVNYISGRYAAEGSHVPNTTVIRTGGATDGNTAISFQIVTTANPNWVAPFEAMPLAELNAVLSTNRVVTVFGVWNSASLPNNDQIWIEARYLGSSLTPLGSVTTQTKANNLAAGAALTADSVSAWDSGLTARANTTVYVTGNTISVPDNAGRVFFCTTGGTSAGSEPAGYATAVDGGSVTDNTATFRAGVRFTLTVTLSSPQPALAGYIYVYVYSALPNSTFWVDPKVTLG